MAEPRPNPVIDIGYGLRLALLGAAINSALATVKIASGVVGRSSALIADGIESCADAVTSLVVWNGLRLGAQPADEKHPYGHGKAESVAGALVSLAIIGAAGLIAYQSIREIGSPGEAPAPFTLLVLVGVIILKECLFRWFSREGGRLESSALKGDAWHHRVDALTSLAAFVGISVSLIGGPGYEAADDWAALLACAVIAFNGFRLLLPAIDEIMDATVESEVEKRLRSVAGEVPGVKMIEKCRVRKSGLQLLMDIHVVVDGDLTVRQGHDIAHLVKDHLCRREPRVGDVVVHIEPSGPKPSSLV
jgi:cation diffusion facilitator family transporter